MNKKVLQRIQTESNIKATITALAKKRAVLETQDITTTRVWWVLSNDFKQKELWAFYEYVLSHYSIKDLIAHEELIASKIDKITNESDWYLLELFLIDTLSRRILINKEGLKIYKWTRELDKMRACDFITRYQINWRNIRFGVQITTTENEQKLKKKTYRVTEVNDSLDEISVLSWELKTFQFDSMVLIHINWAISQYLHNEWEISHIKLAIIKWIKNWYKWHPFEYLENKKLKSDINKFCDIYKQIFELFICLTNNEISSKKSMKKMLLTEKWDSINIHYSLRDCFIVFSIYQKNTKKFLFSFKFFYNLKIVEKLETVKTKEPIECINF